MNDMTLIISKMDALVDTYHSGVDPEGLVALRRELAIYFYRLSEHVRQSHGEAGLAYIRRKFEVAKRIDSAMRENAKLSAAKAETAAEAVEEIKAAREAEVWAEAAREALRTKIEGVKSILASMQQEIAAAAYEKRTTHYQETSAK